jgi:hypothetical protein
VSSGFTAICLNTSVMMPDLDAMLLSFEAVSTGHFELI